MNKKVRKWVCQRCLFSFIYRLFKCKQYNRLYRMCSESRRRARGTCPHTFMVEFRCVDKKVGYCNLRHVKPQTETHDEEGNIASSGGDS